MVKITKTKKLKISKPRNPKLRLRAEAEAKISSETKLNEILIKKPKAAEILFEAGLSCVGCPMAMSETIEQGCLAHGMSKKQVDELIKRLNKK